MSSRGDRGLQSQWKLYAGAGTLAFLLSATGAFLWHRWSAPPEVPQPAVQTATPMAQLLRRDENQTITLFYPSDGMLTSGTAQVRRQPDAQSQARHVVQALLADRRGSLAPVLGDLDIRELYLDRQGTAYLDLSPKGEIRASAWDEILALYALVNTLMQNDEEIRQVCLLIEGREASTLAGHTDLTRKFTRRTDLVRQ